MKTIIGKAWYNEDWEGESGRHYMEVTSLEDSEDTLDDILYDYDEKDIKITIEEISSVE